MSAKEAAARAMEEGLDPLKEEEVEEGEREKRECNCVCERRERRGITIWTRRGSVDDTLTFAKSTPTFCMKI